MLPSEKGKARNGHLNQSWLSKGLLKSIKRKNILYKRYLCNPSSDRKNQYKKYRNKLISSLRAAKRIYYAKKLEECKSNMKSTSTILNEVINNKKVKVIYQRRLMLMKFVLAFVQELLKAMTKLLMMNVIKEIIDLIVQPLNKCT